MKTIGFIDYYLDEWHANNYPAWIKEHSEGEFEVRYAYAPVESPHAGSISNAEWAKQHGVELLDSIDEVVEKSDCIIVLSPDNCEMHYELSEKALKTGKRVYIDKTFADDRETAEKIFRIAEENGTPCFSSSALRFSDKYAVIAKEGIQSIISTGGGSSTHNYIIHQLEPITILMGLEVSQVMYIGNQEADSFVLKYKDGRTVTVNMLSGNADFSLWVRYAGSNKEIVANDDFFQRFIDSLVHFFRTGEIPVSHEETITIMAIREACLKSKMTPFEWLDI